MTPAARIEAAINVLDRIGPDLPAEQALTNWARGARFAGSGDRAAVRDHVFDVLRRWRSTAAAGGGETGRCRMLGLLRQHRLDPETLFTGTGYGPAPLSDEERQAGRTPDTCEAMDLPDWLNRLFRAELGDDAEPVALALRSRAPVFLRVNALLCPPARAIEALTAEGIVSAPHPLSPQALMVTGNARRVHQSQAYRDGWIELQDAASQAVVDLLPLHAGQRVLDYCAGGGGKTLAMAARLAGPVDAHDANPARLRDLPVRAARAQADVRLIDTPVGPYDLVLCDVPCSGSGAWRRSPEGKWTLTPDKLESLQQLQARILDDVAPLVAAGGTLAYATCSVLPSENQHRIRDFLALNPGWTAGDSRQFRPDDGGDGFFIACVQRSQRS